MDLLGHALTAAIAAITLDVASFAYALPAKAAGVWVIARQT